MYRIFTTLLVTLLISTVQAQSLQVTLSDYDLHLPSAMVNSDGVSVSDNGTVIQTGSYSLPSEPDPSIKAYALNSGAVILRENIANFLFYDSFGNIQRSISNSTQSEGGEAISELSVDPAGKTVILFNPKIVSGGNTGSRAKLVTGASNPVDIFYSRDRALRTVEVSSNGELIALATMKDGTDDEVTILDRFGNNLGTISFDQDVKGASFSENGLYITIYSGGRAAAFEIRNRERVGSTSFRNTSLIYANYSPEDNTIVALTGAGSEEYTELEAHAVNVEARKIARTDVSGSVSAIHQPSLKRTANGRYTITGFDRTLSFRASF